MNIPHPFEALLGREVIVYSGDAGASSDRGRVEFCDATVVVVSDKKGGKLIFPMSSVRLIKIADGKG
jgi:hypothetical protein